MDNVLTYLKKYGRYDLTELAFNEIDSLILAQLSYLKFDGIVPGVDRARSFASMMDIFKHPDREKMYFSDHYEENNRCLFEHVAFSKRFQNMKLRFYESLTDTELETQFAAVTFFPENGPVYVAYRGTDETLIGWKEDFNMAFQAPVPAQKAGVRYLNAVAPKIKAQTFHVGGHSKGGNVAVYSAMRCEEKVQQRIRYVYNHDGPGFVASIMDTGEYDKIREKVVKLVPQSSLIGMLLQHKDDYRVVMSTGKEGITQHDPYTWLVDGTAFQYSDNVKHGSRKLNQKINQWISSLDQSQLQVFVDTLYEVVAATEAQTLLDVSNEWKDNAVKMANAFKDVDQETKKMIHQVLKGLFIMNRKK